MLDLNEKSEKSYAVGHDATSVQGSHPGRTRSTSVRRQERRSHRKVDHFVVPFIAEASRNDFVAYFHRNYGHFSTPVLDGVCRARGWWEGYPQVRQTMP